MIFHENTIQLSLCQKPTRAHVRLIDEKLKKVKRKGWRLYRLAKKNTREMADYKQAQFQATIDNMLAKQDLMLERMDGDLKEKVERTLKLVKEKFLKETEGRAQEIFKRANQENSQQLIDTNKRVDDLVYTHSEQVRMFNELTETTKLGIASNDKINTVFTKESESFFLERLKWKADA